jgi:hypothetical protein
MASSRLVLVLGAALLVAACVPGAAASYDPAAPCNGADEQSQAGFYPDLEALVPTAVAAPSPSAGASPEAQATLGPPQSGRFCSANTLGTLAEKGVAELRFAGSLWPTGDAQGISLAVYRAAGLTTDLLADSFTAAASKASAVAQISTQAVTIVGRHGVRISVNNQDQLQTVVFWGSATPDTVNAVIAADPSEARLQVAIAAFGSR